MEIFTCLIESRLVWRHPHSETELADKILLVTWVRPIHEKMVHFVIVVFESNAHFLQLLPLRTSCISPKGTNHLGVLCRMTGRLGLVVVIYKYDVHFAF